MAEKDLSHYARASVGLIRTAQKLSDEKAESIYDKFQNRISLEAAREACLSLEDFATPTTRDLYNCLAGVYWAQLLVFLTRLPKTLDGDSLIKNFSIEGDPALAMAIQYIGDWETLCTKYIINKQEAQESFYKAFQSCFISDSMPLVHKVKGVNESKRSWDDAYVLLPSKAIRDPENFYRVLTQEERSV